MCFWYHSGLPPGIGPVIAAGDTDAASVVSALLGPSPDAKPLWYQKHMSHHLLPGFGREWIHALRNVLLIRDPGEVVASYVKSRATVAPDDIGLPQQGVLFDELADRAGTAPPVIDAADFLRAPEAHLRALCAWLGIDFTGRMLQWPSGPRATDGIWAQHWYDAVWASTGFEPYRHRDVRLEGDAARVADACRPVYERLRAHRMQVA